MTNKVLHFLTITLILSCGTSMQNEERTEEFEGSSELMNSTESVSQIDQPELRNLIGQWRAEGNTGVGPNWLEFDASTNEFYSWLDGEPRPTYSSGTYNLVSDTLLELSFSKYNEQKRFALHSVGQNYLDMLSLEVSSDNLIYKRTSYEYPEQKIIFFHLSQQEFDSVAALPDYQGLYEVSSDFGFYVSKVMDSLKNSSIATELTTERYIEIANKRLDKFDEHGYGAVLIRPDSIFVEGGVMIDMDYFQLISEFFKE